MTDNKNKDTGTDSLYIISAAEKFNHWMFQTISRFCTDEILEIGSGIGNISQFFIRQQAQISLSDYNIEYCNILKHKYPQNNVFQLDLANENFETKYSTLCNTFSTVFALNVIEHIENDSLAIRNCSKLLKTNGKLIILVPAYSFLYCQFDTNLGHFRRYTKNKLTELIQKNGFELFHSQYFNAAGIPGWLFSGKILNRKMIPSSQMAIFNKIVPLFKLLDKISFHQFGLSAISVGIKK